MKKLSKITGKIEYYKRLNCSVYGNPRYEICVGGLYLTSKSDYSYNYEMMNFVNKDCEVEIEYYETKTSYRIETIKEVK